MESKLDLLSSGGRASGMYLFRAVASRVDSIAVGHKCTAADVETMADLSVTFSDGGGTELKSNITRCQDPIMGFSVAYSAEDTVQQASWDAVYLAVGEAFEVAVRTTRGNPITYEIDWEGRNSSKVTEEDQGAASNQINSMACAKESIIPTENSRLRKFTHAYTAAGTYHPNVTAFSLQADRSDGDNKFVQNSSQTVVVQMPVEQWTIKALDSWIKEAGGGL